MFYRFGAYGSKPNRVEIKEESPVKFGEKIFKENQKQIKIPSMKISNEFDVSTGIISICASMAGVYL